MNLKCKQIIILLNSNLIEIIHSNEIIYMESQVFVLIPKLRGVRIHGGSRDKAIFNKYRIWNRSNILSTLNVNEKKTKNVENSVRKPKIEYLRCQRQWNVSLGIQVEGVRFESIRIIWPLYSQLY